MIQPGQLDRKVTVQSKTVTRDEFGGVVETWADLVTRAARKIDQGGREFRAAGVTNAEVTTIFRMRFFPTLTAKHQISHDGKTYAIVSVTEGDGRRVETIAQTKVNP